MSWIGNLMVAGRSRNANRDAASWTKHPMDLAHYRQKLAEVLENVHGNHLIETFVRERPGDLIEVRQNIR